MKQKEAKKKKRENIENTCSKENKYEGKRIKKKRKIKRKKKNAKEEKR